ncbi:hypothetical protein PS627_02728 [Pseudomonas fluorescens]|uniref:dermonecrotic toxin domain-containing protein n=1 Tax=Pseudomonas fluorescens TaxID=294 RepID=UPI001253DB2B|nr:DUF6543 domain-containing protein [Pseudomonas fluorescens]CAG8867967.1 hypothetical protein PS627_02728 [Pseudomonas fluorescens]
MSSTPINPAGVQYVRDHLANIPRPDRAAERAIEQWLSTQGVKLPPDRIDVVTLHLHPDSAAGYQAAVAQRVSLTQALLMNWQGESDNDIFGALFKTPWAGTLPGDGPITLVDRLDPQPLGHTGAWYEVFNGLFRRTEPARYDHSTLLDLRAEALQRHIEALDFHARYTASLDAFWQAQLANHRLCCKLNFIAACNKQVGENSLSDAARKLAWRAAGLTPRGSGLRLSTLSIYGYAATDLLYIHDIDSALTVLYVPGNSAPLLEFASENLLKDWVGQQCKSPARRQALKQHFRLADGPQGIDFSGLDTALEGLGAYPLNHSLPPEHGFFNDDGTWPPRTYVNYRPGKYNPRITGDLFQALAERQRQRTYDDADFIITSNGEVTKSRWAGYLNCTLNLLAPVTFVVPGLAPLLALGGIVQLGLGLDQAINGKTLRDKNEGLGNIAYGLFNAAPLAVHAAASGGKLFSFKSGEFVSLSRINEQWGYPLSPMDAPRLPELDGAPFFEAGDAPAAPVGPPQPYYPVSRTLDWTARTESISGWEEVDEYSIQVDLVYDLEADLFIKKADLNSVSPTYYQSRADERFLQRVNPDARPVTNQMRRETLRVLDVDLSLPVQIPVRPGNLRPIPKTISSLWVGDKTLSPALLDNLARNSERLQQSAYRYRLFLSNANPQAYAQNLQLLRAKAPGLIVETLEEQAFFRAFQESENFAQYQAAIDGNGGVATNYSSASDVLRYPMLYEQGGLYMDVDDELLAAGSTRRTYLGADTAVVEPIDTVELAATEEGLLLQPPICNHLLDMRHQFNSSMIGSHPGNPTLRAISREMHLRYQADPHFYSARPSRLDDPAAFHDYASRLSRLTGPALLTDMVDRLLPDLYRMRQIEKMIKLPMINGHNFLDIEQWQVAERSLMPLRRIAAVGSTQSWATH